MPVTEISEETTVRANRLVMPTTPFLGLVRGARLNLRQGRT